MSSDVVGPPSLLRYATITALVLTTLGAGVAFVIRGGTATTNYVDKATEAVVCTATGGLAKYAYCNWREPQTDAGSGSIITGIYYTIGKNPAVVGVDFTIGPSAILSGATLAVPNMQNIQTASGKTVLYLSGALEIGSGDYLRGVTLSNPKSAHTATMMIDYRTRLSK